MKTIYRILFLLSISSTSIMAMDPKANDEILNVPQLTLSLKNITYNGLIEGEQGQSKQSCVVQGKVGRTEWIFNDEKKVAFKKFMIDFSIDNKEVSKEYLDLTEVAYIPLGKKTGVERGENSENIVTVYSIETFRRPDYSELRVRQDLYRLQEIVEWEKTTEHTCCLQEQWFYVGHSNKKLHLNITYSQTKGRQLIYRFPLEKDSDKVLMVTKDIVKITKGHGSWFFKCGGKGLLN